MHQDQPSTTELPLTHVSARSFQSLRIYFCIAVSGQSIDVLRGLPTVRIHHIDFHYKDDIPMPMQAYNPDLELLALPS